MSRPNVLSLLFFRPHGGRLLTSGAQLWLSTTWVLSCMIAATEGWVVYSLLAQIGATPEMRIGAAVAVFCAIFLVDASFVLLDTASSGAHEVSTLQRYSRVLLALGVRAGIFLLTFLVTIPVATIALLDDELRAERDVQWATAVDAAQSRREAELAAPVTQAQRQLDEIRQHWSDEVNADVTKPGVSGKAGVGARARKYERDQRVVEQELRDAESALASYRAEMAGLGFAERARALGVTVTPLTFAERVDLMQQIEDRPGVQKKSLLVKAYLLMAFASVLLLKLLSPATVQVYLNEGLQQAFRAAQNGEFTPLLRFGPPGVPPERMGPLAFRKWGAEVLPLLIERAEAMHRRGEARAAMTAFGQDLQHAAMDCKAAALLRERAAAEHLQAELQSERQRAQVTRVKEQLQQVAQRERELSGATKWPATQAHSEMVEKLAEVQEQLLVVEGKLRLLGQQQATRAAELERAQQRLQQAVEREVTLQTALAEAEQRYLEAASTPGVVPVEDHTWLHGSGEAGALDTVDPALRSEHVSARLAAQAGSQAAGAAPLAFAADAGGDDVGAAQAELAEPSPKDDLAEPSPSAGGAFEPHASGSTGVTVSSSGAAASKASRGNAAFEPEAHRGQAPLSLMQASPALEVEKNDGLDAEKPADSSANQRTAGQRAAVRTPPSARATPLAEEPQGPLAVVEQDRASDVAPEEKGSAKMRVSAAPRTTQAPKKKSSTAAVSPKKPRARDSSSVRKTDSATAARVKPAAKRRRSTVSES